jgi:glutaredoxin
MGARVLILIAAAMIGALLLGAYQIWRLRFGHDPERLDIDALGLELMTGCCAFVFFTTPACRPCKAALLIVEGAAAKRPGLTEVRTVDALERAELANRYDVRTIPTIFLITASGHIVKRWKRVPDAPDVEDALKAV